MEKSVKQRVKVYELNDQSQWADKGTGYVTCKYVESMKTYYVVVISEDDPSVTLMNSKVLASQGEMGYQRQQDTLIVWTEPDSVDVALSFQDPDGCQELWDQLHDVRSKIIAEAEAEGNSNHFEYGEHLTHDDFFASSEMSLLLPTLANLKEVEDALRISSRITFGKDRLADYIQQNNYIEKLLQVFEKAEDLESTEDLYILYNIAKLIISLNDLTLYATITLDKYMIPFCGMLEYDPDFPSVRGRFREHLSQRVNFKKVITIHDEKVQEKIHQSFRMQYLRDVVCARWQEDATFSTFTQAIYSNQVDIMNYLSSHMEFLEEILSPLNSNTTDIDQKREILAFVKDLISIAKAVNSNVPNFFRSLGHHGFFNIFHANFNSPDLQIRIVTSEILCAIVDDDALLVRSFNLAQAQEGFPPLIDLLCERIAIEPDIGLKTQISETLRLLLDTGLAMDGRMLSSYINGNMNSENDTEEFLELFYEKVIVKLVAPIMQIPQFKAKSNDVFHLNANDSESIYLIVELLTMMVKCHHYRIKNFLMQYPVSKHIATLLSAKMKHIQLAAIRFFRAQVGQTDVFYNKHIISNNLFDPFVRCLIQTGDRYNLVNSACNELFDFIRKNNVKNLIQYTIEHFGEDLSQITYVDTFKDMKLRYEQNIDVPSSESADPESHDTQNLDPKMVGQPWIQRKKHTSMKTMTLIKNKPPSHLRKSKKKKDTLLQYPS